MDYMYRSNVNTDMIDFMSRSKVNIHLMDFMSRSKVNTERVKGKALTLVSAAQEKKIKTFCIEILLNNLTNLL